VDTLYERARCWPMLGYIKTYRIERTLKDPCNFLLRAIAKSCYLRRCRPTSLMRNRSSLGPYNRPTPRALRWSQGVGVFS
jgi:hypothetical protein